MVRVLIRVHQIYRDLFEIDSSLVHYDKNGWQSCKNGVECGIPQRQEKKMRRKPIKHLKVYLTKCHESVFVDVKTHECRYLTIHFKSMQEQTSLELVKLCQVNVGRNIVGFIIVFIILYDLDTNVSVLQHQLIIITVTNSQSNQF